MLIVKSVASLKENERLLLSEFLESKAEALPYHTLEFANFINNYFKYKDLSLVVFDENAVVAYLPQWLKRGIIESVPWRDKAGPLYSNEAALSVLIVKCKQLVSEHKAKGFIWKDTSSKLLDNYKYFINVELDLGGLNENILWKRIKNRNKLRQAFTNNLKFIEEKSSPEVIKKFFSLFVQNRKKMGVPTYSEDFFNLLVKNFKKENIKIFSIYDDVEILASMIMFCTPNRAIDAFRASNEKALRLRGNDFLLWSVINYCIRNKIKVFDFGADSPVQKSLIDFKLNWSGVKREIVTSLYGNVKECDHNTSYFNFAKMVLSRLPTKLFILVSRVVIKLC